MKILLVVEPERKDWYQYLKSDSSNKYILLWHEARLNIPKWLEEESFFKEVYAWTDFNTPQKLLNEIRPERIVFFEIIDQRQIALLVTANKKAIRTFYLEHGAAGDSETAIKRANERNFFVNKKRKYLVQRFRKSAGKMVSSKIFYYSAIFHLSSFSSLLKFCRLPFSMLVSAPNKALAKCLFPERTPYRSIVFNQPNFEQFQLYTGIKKEQAVFTGVPIFDGYYSQVKAEQDQICYIDHPYLEEGILGWTTDHHENTARLLSRFAESRRIKMLIKLHPRSDVNLWLKYNLGSSYFKIVQTGDFTTEFLRSKIILSYSSSLVNGFLCARKNVVLLGWHPQPGIFGADFSQTGLCHCSLAPAELANKFEYWVAHNLAKNNETDYLDFLRKFNWPFDGKAGVRVLNTITAE